MTNTNPIAMAHDYADAFYNAAMRPGSGNVNAMCPAVPTDNPKFVRLVELYAAQAIGSVSPAAADEMHMIEDQFKSEMTL